MTVCVLVYVGVIAAAAQSPQRTVWDGVYTPAQAARGQDVYDKSCGECHQADLSGGGDEAAAVLKGPDFFARWQGRSVGDLVNTISRSMPKTAPGSLSAEAYVEVVSFLMRKNLVPAAETELSPDERVLGQIAITARPK